MRLTVLITGFLLVLGAPLTVHAESQQCTDFDSWVEAQWTFETDPEEFKNLDVDEDGIACETLMSDDDVAPAETLEPTETDEPPHERCIAATDLPNEAELNAWPDRPEEEQLIADIEYGLVEGVTLSDVWVTKSDDFENVWFIGGKLNSPGLDDDIHVAVWATNRINEDGGYTGTGLLLSVGELANEFSDWGDAGSTDAEISLSADGADEVMDCARDDD